MHKTEISKQFNLASIKTLDRFLPLFTCFIFTIIVYYVHNNPHTRTMSNFFLERYNSDWGTYAVNWHNTLPAFVKRPLANWTIQFSSNIFDISIQDAWKLVNFSFLFLSGLALQALSFALGGTLKQTLLNLFVFYFSFSNVFAFFPPLYTHDEPIQFFFLFLALLALKKGNSFFYIITFTLSLIARESGLILIPAIVIYFLYEQSKSFSQVFKPTFIIKLVLLGTPFIIYSILIAVLIRIKGLEDGMSQDILERFKHIPINFGSQAKSIESIFNIFLILGVGLYFSFWGLIRKGKNESNHLKYIKAFLLTCVINTIIVLTTTQAKEARLFVIPMFFLWPVFGQLFMGEIEKLKFSEVIKCLISTKYLIAFTVSLGVSSLFIFTIYNITDGWMDYNLFREYFFMLAIIILTHFFVNIHQVKNSNKAIS